MSPRQDQYISLCLEQAANSPLHYKHGCIIVKGGKVIGKGYNHYRPGFNDGTLKTGQVSSPVSEKSLKNVTQTEALASTEESGDSFHGQSVAVKPLSMHSEMMAIRSALSLSSLGHGQASARSTAWLKKPCSKLPGGSKRDKLSLGIEAYVKAVCDEAGRIVGSSSDVERYTGKASSGEWCFEPNEHRFVQTQQQDLQQQHGEREREEREKNEREGTPAYWLGTTSQQTTSQVSVSS